MELTPQIQYPLFYKCSTQSEWAGLNNQANELLGFSNELAQSYSTPIIDKDGKHWFVVNPEVSELVDLNLCKPYETIQFNQNIL